MTSAALSGFNSPGAHSPPGARSSTAKAPGLTGQRLGGAKLRFAAADDFKRQIQRLGALAQQRRRAHGDDLALARSLGYVYQQVGAYAGRFAATDGEARRPI